MSNKKLEFNFNKIDLEFQTLNEYIFSIFLLNIIFFQSISFHAKDGVSFIIIID